MSRSIRMMRLEAFLDLCRRCGRRPAVIQAGDSAVAATCGMEGRLFHARGGELVSLFRPEAAEKISSAKNGYFNPGGDGLWPAPEGTTSGYEYATGAWRVPSGVVGAQYEIAEQGADHFAITAEIDLINNRQLGLPCRFTRRARVRETSDGTTVIEQFDAIEYLGGRVLRHGEFLLAPWSLSQFAVNARSQARFGDPGAPVRDLYMPSGKLLSRDGDTMIMKHDRDNRIQLALPEKSSFVELPRAVSECITPSLSTAVG